MKNRELLKAAAAEGARQARQAILKNPVAEPLGRRGECYKRAVMWPGFQNSTSGELRICAQLPGA